MIGYFIRKVRDIKNEFRCLNTPLVLSDYRYEEQKAAYETKVRQLGLQLKSAEKKFDQKFRKEIDKVMKHYHELEKNMRETLEQLQKERLANVDDSTKLIVQYLVNGKIHSAWDVFNNKTKGIGNDNITGMLNRIIGKAFTDNVPIKNVIRFTGGLKDNVDAMVYGAIRVFNELEYRLIFDPITVDLMYATIEDLIKTCIDLEGTDSEESQLTVDEHMLDKLIVINNKIEFLKYTYGQ
ncbi:hypothetical protein GHT06_013936 [Daphnia sinensis]|uniref:Uncharacterized protein n=1 Tax=Daphnia sinensis TaxID=1820382 RepID=A0AAD5KUR3_9CRUS|nr:hypothetical protein GHT06_013936 [Daphnia sinensis]